MTSPPPLGEDDPRCSYCLKLGMNPIKFKIGRDINWACGKRHFNTLIKDMKHINPRNKNKVTIITKSNSRNAGEKTE